MNEVLAWKEKFKHGAKSYFDQMKSGFRLLKEIIKTERNFIKQIDIL